jgi:hypothetical protein
LQLVEAELLKENFMHRKFDWWYGDSNPMKFKIDGANLLVNRQLASYLQGTISTRHPAAFLHLQALKAALQ